MQMKSFSFTRPDGCELWCNRWFPDEEQTVKGIVILQHGIKEHSLRYDRFATILAESGYIVQGYDLRGHGRTAEIGVMKNKSNWDKVADYNGDKILIEDLHTVVESLKNEFSDKKIFLIGHSFGSFIIQRFIELYDNMINGVVLLGSCGPDKSLVFTGNVISKIVRFFTGKNYYSKFLNNLFFGSYNKKIKNPKTEFDWFTHDELVVQMYCSDNWCGHLLTNSYLLDITNLLKVTHKKKNISKISKDLSILVAYGLEDPVGKYGKTISKLVEIYKANGIKDLEEKCYQNCRHELLNEIIKEDIEKDIITWLDSK